MSLQIASRLKLVVSLAVLLVVTNYSHARGFLPAVNYPTGLEPFSIAVDDFNGDNRPDVAVLIILRAL
jgi:hypothetical protein